MTVVVTGASGFLGSQVVRAFRAAGYRTLGVGRRAGAAVDRVIRSYSDLVDSKIIGQEHASCVLVHAAANPRVDDYRTDRNLARSLVDTAEQLARLPWRAIVFASSAAIYEPRRGAVKIDESGTLADTPYARAKRGCEDRILAQNGVVLRLTNLIGAGMGSDTVVGNIASQVDGNCATPATGSATRLQRPKAIRVRDATAVLDLLSVTDAAAAFVQCQRHLDNTRGRIINIGSGRPITVGELTQLMLESAGRPAFEIESTGPQKQSGVVLDSELAQSLIGWHPQTPIETCLAHIVPPTVAP